MLLYNTTLDGNEEARDQNRTQISRRQSITCKVAQFYKNLYQARKSLPEFKEITNTEQS